MTREISIGDTVYTPCTCFNTGEKWLDEKRIKDIGEEFILLTHVATLRKRGEKLHREEVTPTDQRGDRKLKDYYSRTFDEIMAEFDDGNKWFAKSILQLASPVE